MRAILFTFVLLMASVAHPQKAPPPGVEYTQKARGLGLSIDAYLCSRINCRIS